MVLPTVSAEETFTRMGNSWQERYDETLSNYEFPSSQVIKDDSAYICDRAIIPARDPRWPDSRYRTGIVIGAIQSGKTASMIGLMARALDSGVNVIVLLAGRQTALWRQTMDRVRAQLLGSSPSLGSCVFIPAPRPEGERYSVQGAYAINERRAARAFKKKTPLVFVVMKEVNHLASMSRILGNNVFPAAAKCGVDVNLLVIDDEADDASIADDQVKLADDSAQEIKRIPFGILDLWADCSIFMKTKAEHVYATYVAYTATPQANFLQNSENPLVPRDFVAALRTPGATGMLHPREVTYNGGKVRNWYIGADIFYGALASCFCRVIDESSPYGDDGENLADVDEASSSLCIATDVLDEELLKQGLRAYIIAAAISIIRSGKLGPSSAADMTFDSLNEVKSKVAPVTSMLIHPSADLDDHFNVKNMIIRWWDGEGGTPGEGVINDLEIRRRTWISEYEDYRASATKIAQVYGDRFDLIATPTWDKVEEVIRREIVPCTRIDAINSRPDSDERPQFGAWVDNSGVWHSPVNHSSIFISGNVMSRGLTLEGLLTTVFLRSSNSPAADTQMQMQRWFGYRGKTLDLCRVYLTGEQLRLFSEYAEADRALRRQVILAMRADDSRLPGVVVLQGQNFRPTSKVSSLTAKTLSPGRRPVVRYMNAPTDDVENLCLVKDLFLAHDAGVVGVPGGLVTSTDYSLTTVVDVLERLRYRFHGQEDDELSRWNAAARLVGIDSTESCYFPLYRAPKVDDLKAHLGCRSPYSLAAYFRLWAASIGRQVDGLMTDENPPQRWNLKYSLAKEPQQPRFRFGLRYGSGEPIEAGPLLELFERYDIPVRPMRRKVVGSELEADWGARRALGHGYSGDDVFDAIVLDQPVRRFDDGTRCGGELGFILFQLVDRGEGEVSVSVAMSIPAGGPDYVRAVNVRNRG
jgi:conserved domain protein